MSLANRTSFSMPSSHEGQPGQTNCRTECNGMVPSDLFPTLCGESQDLGELLNPQGLAQEESLGVDRSLFLMSFRCVVV
jgi:hypothetical protein